jgi:hypothetical protein
LPYCRKCGKQNVDDAIFCASCGIPLTVTGPEAEDIAKKVQKDAQNFAKKMQQEGEKISQDAQRQIEGRFGRASPETLREEALFGAVSAGVVLLLLALTVLRYPSIFTVLGDYFTSMGDTGTLLRPPSLILHAGAFFFAAVGLWTLALAVMRFLVQRSSRRALGDVVGALFSFLVAFVLSGYAAGRYGGGTSIALIVVGLGAVIIANGVIAAATRRQKTIP